MCTNLAKRGATYYFRRAIPAELRPAFDGKAELMVSLRTKDRETAKRLIPARRIESDRLLDAARRMYRENRPERAASAQSDRAGYVEAEKLRGSLTAAERAENEQAEREARYEDREPLRQRLERAFRKSTAEITPDEAAMRDLLRDAEHRVSVAEGRLLSERVRRAEDRRGLAAPRPVEPQPVAALARGEPVPLIELFDAYAAETRIKVRTANEWRGTLRALVRFVGHGDAARLTVEDIERWRDALLSENGARGKPRDAGTVKRNYIGALKTTLSYGVSKRKLAANVAKDVDVRVPRKPKLRERDFTEEEAGAILAATLEPADSELSEYTARARRWIPWLCAYTGARVNEISQLRGGDVTQIDGIWSIRITPEAGTVKTGEARTVPLHPHLIEQGFPAIAKAAGDAPIFYDPSRARRLGAGNRHVSKVGEKLAAWVRETAGITDPNVQPNHGWRHTFKTRAQEAGIAERTADAIQGHAPRSVGQTYGRVSLRVMNEAISKMPRFDVPGSD